MAIDPLKAVVQCGLASCLAVGLLAVGISTEARVDGAWNPKSAAAYLDQRAEWWMTWPGAARDHDTFCISCHTAVPFALARPSLRAALGENGPSGNERKLLNNITRRTRLWKEVGPSYNDQVGVNKAVESRGTEAVLNALVLASYDAANGQISDDTRVAFENMWALQRTTGEDAGAWWWLQFNFEPWEGHDSAYYGAALAALAVGLAPGDYRSAPEIQPNLKLLREYLDREYPKQSAINHAVLLWAAAKWPGLLSAERQRLIIGDLIAQQQADGGWNLGSLVWSWRDWTVTSLRMWLRSESSPWHEPSDGYATALVVFALEQAGFTQENAHLKQGIAWLARNQNKTEGYWPSFSVNGPRDHSTGVGRFMNDAATAYAVLALTHAQ